MKPFKKNICSTRDVIMYILYVFTHILRMLSGDQKQKQKG